MWLYSAIPRKFAEMPHPASSVHRWILLAHDHPAQWRKLVSTALDAVVNKTIGLQREAPDSSSIASELQMQMQTFVCYECGYEATSLQGLQVHRSKQHGYVHLSRLLVGDTATCRCCLINYWTRARLIRHLRERKAAKGFVPCLDLLEHFAEPIEESERKKLDSQEASENKAARSRGHLRPPALAPPIPSQGPRRRFPNGARALLPRFWPQQALL